MDPIESQLTIHMCDDDPDDRLLFQEAMERAHLLNEVTFTQDGQDLMDFLNRVGNYSELKDKPLPDVILLDLNMPRMDGREALKAIKSNSKFKHIPVVVLTTSKQEEDILKSYNLGANSFISKPVTFDRLVELLAKLSEYWFKIVKLPKSS